MLCITSSWDELSTISKDKKTLSYFNHYIEESEAAKITKEFEDKILPILHEFVELGIGFQDTMLVTKKRHLHVAQRIVYIPMS